MITVVTFALVLQQVVASTTPPSRDPADYWQQRADYEIHAQLDETSGVLHARALLTYVNHSPDTLREFYVHQHLNAFRPGSKWSAVDEREGRERFQRLADPEHAYERFTAVPTFDGTPAPPVYPGAPDSTVARFTLPRALAPGDSTLVDFSWDARLSTLPRRQGRRGRHFDFAQWYPRVAVYDRDGWRPNALQPAGEFYGEFGRFDVTLLLRDDQVLGTTGVVADGDPGWQGALRFGEVPVQPAAYSGGPDRRLSAPAVPPGHKLLRITARDVHHFGWSISPTYRYEGGWFVRQSAPRPMRFPVWDSVAVHVLYQPGDEVTWGRGQVLDRTRTALAWLENVFGPYGYPQMTTLHRVEGGGTEFPMLMMNGSPSQGLILHEGGHIYAHGILANNEWRSGWMDEGLTSYQTAWAQGLTLPERIGQPVLPPAARGYRGLALRPDNREALTRQQALLDIRGLAEPIGTNAAEFTDFTTYSRMIYGRAEWMFGALRDAMGDSAFLGFLRGYYDEWAFRHVDELAMRTAASRAAGTELDWFFDQWVHHTGLVDYALRGVDIRPAPAGTGWETTATVERRGAYRHPMPVGVRTSDGWTLERAEVAPDRQDVRLTTAAPPLEVRLDPLRTTPDWYRPNDVATRFRRLDPRTADIAFDWPFLHQERADRYVTLVTPLIWYSTPGGATVALRARSHYFGLLDRLELGLAVSQKLPVRGRFESREGDPQEGSRPSARFQGWLVREDPLVFGSDRPWNGVSAGIWRLDGIWKLDARKQWDLSRSNVAGIRTIATLGALGTYPYDRNFPDPRRWSGRNASEGMAAIDVRTPDETGLRAGMSVSGGVATGGDEDETTPYVRGEAFVAARRTSATGRWTHFGRLYAGGSVNAPVERGIYASALSPTQSFVNHLLRPDGAPLAREDFRFIPLGGAALRGFDPLLIVENIAALNLEESLLLRSLGAQQLLGLYASVFTDVGVVLHSESQIAGEAGTVLSDAGVGLALRGPLLDRDVRLRLDFPVYVSQPALSYARRRQRENAAAWRVTFSLTDLW